MLESVLIANRGEIALRIIRACKELGIKTVAIYSDADASSIHLRFADEAYRIGSSDPSESYLNADKIVEMAGKAGVEAVHPGYGFLSENAEFARKCNRHNLIFIGPKSQTLEITGDKIEARCRVANALVPTLPSINRIIEDEDEVLEAAERIGYPVLMKSVYGGGGRGIRFATDKKQLLEEFRPAQMEAKASFGKFGVYVEKFLEKARHIEFQVLADSHGHIVHLCERECSIQRRFQKLLEMSPSPIIGKDLRERMGEAATKAAEAVKYTNAGTVEFLVDRELNFYFIEINARLQVEHPVTEMVTGIDIVKEQFKISSGKELDMDQRKIHLNGCALECRINAEDPIENFMPQAGKINKYNPPSGPFVRVDTHLYSPYEVHIHYDSLLAKLITWGRDFSEAVLRMSNALDEFVIQGISTTIPFHRFIVGDQQFQEGKLSTDFIESRKIIDRMKEEKAKQTKYGEEIAAIAAAMHESLNQKSIVSEVTQHPHAKFSRWRNMVSDEMDWRSRKFVDRT